MGFDLLKVFGNSDLKKFGQSSENIIKLSFNVNKKTGARIARAVLDNGSTLIKTVTASGTVIQSVTQLPKITSVAQRNEVIRDLSKNKITQEMIAAMLDVSQSTVSNVLKVKK